MQPGCIPRRRRPPDRPPARRYRTLPPFVAAFVLGACAATTPSLPPPLPVADRASPIPGALAGESVLADVRPGGAAARLPRRESSTATEGASLDELFVRARALVEAESGTDLSAVRLELVDDASILAEVSAETRRLVRGQLGDGPLAERLLATLVHGQIGTYAALYSGRHRAVMVSEEVLAGYVDSLGDAPEAREQALLVLMLHELVHAADDLRHDIHANRTLDFRASFAQSAVFEGHAQWLTREICRRERCLDGLAALDAFMFDDGETRVDGRLSGRGGDGLAKRRASTGEAAGGDGVGRGAVTTRRSSTLDRNLLEYSYVEGERFVTALAAREDGAAVLERLLAEPPHDPLQILAPTSFPDVARETRNRALLAVARGVGHAWNDGPDARVPIATSPLKGVDLRDDPARREAAIDGFTRLVTAMVAVQFHDPRESARPPIEVTLMRTDRPDTARLFADTLHAHARLPGAIESRVESERGASGDAGAPTNELMRTELPAGGGDAWRTAIATAGHFVVQASGRTGASASIDAYVLAVLDGLLAGEGADEEPV